MSGKTGRERVGAARYRMALSWLYNRLTGENGFNMYPLTVSSALQLLNGARFSMPHKEIIIVAILSISFTASAAFAQNIPYQSDEFNDPNSRVPSIFACMFAGDASGLDPAATETAVEFLLSMGITSDTVDTWAHDATIYISQELSGANWSNYWRQNCEDQFENLRSGKIK